MKLLKMFNIRKGKCKKCGACCRNITFRVEDRLLSDVEEFESLKRWQSRYHHFYVSGQDEAGTLLFTCKSLGDDNSCRSYFIRSLYCRLYPTYKQTSGETLEGCGFSFEFPA